MNPTEYQEKANRTVCNQLASLERLAGQLLQPSQQSQNRMQLLHSLIGASGELGELCTFVQKWIWYGKELNPEEIVQKLSDEFGDLLWYIAEGLSAVGVDMQKVMEANLAKLRIRYPEKYTDHLAQEENRNRVSEHQAIVNVLGRNLPVKVKPVRVEQDGHGFGHVVTDDDGQPE